MGELLVTVKTHARRAILVLGMHRSGTSALSGVLAKLGAQAPRSLMAATKDNPKGYWESQELFAFHERLLRSAGSRWSDWGPFNPGWYDTAIAGKFREEIPALIEKEFGQAPLLLIKDPRICRFLPLWLDALASLQVEPCVVIAMRNPQEVAASLEVRNNFGRSRSLLLWLRHMLDAEQASRGLPRSFLAYENLLRDWKGSVEKLSSDLLLTWPRVSAESSVDIESYLSASLKHHSSDQPIVGVGSELGAWVSDVYSVMARLCNAGTPTEADTAVFDRVRNDLDRTSEVYAHVVREHEVHVEAQYENARSQLVEMSRAMEDMGEKMEELQGRIQARDEDLARRDADDENERKEAARKEAEHLEIARQEVGRLADEIQLREGEVCDLTGKLQATEEEVQLLQVEVSLGKKRFNSVQGRLRAVEEDLGRTLVKAKDMAVQRDDALSKARKAQHGNETLVRQLLLNDAPREEDPRLAFYRRQLEFIAQESRDEVVDLRRQIVELLDSHSWKLTSPLRFLSRVMHGRKENDLDRAAFGSVDPSWFDRQWYLASNQDVASSGADPFTHYIEFGAQEGRRPAHAVAPARAPKVDPKVTQRTEVAAIRTSDLFDAEWYVKEYPDVSAIGLEPAEHYHRFGLALMRNPSPKFDAEFYIRSHPDVARSGINPLLHYIRSGRREGRKMSAVRAAEASQNAGLAPHPPAPVRPARSALRQPRHLPTGLPFVSIIILNRDGASMLDAALRSFYAHNTYPNFELIVVDHASSDGSVELLNRWQGVLPLTTIACDQNFSFSYSNNRAAEIAKGEYLLLMNNDVVFANDVLGRMVAALETESVGAVGLKQIQGSPTSYDPGFVYHTGIRFDWNLEGRFLQPRNQNGNAAVDRLLAENPAAFPAITASLFLCRKSDYDAVGGLEEAYVYGYEDVDLCCKFRYVLGKELLCLNSDVAYHNESSSRNLVSRDETRTQRLNNRAVLLERFGYQIRREFVERMFSDDGSFLGRQISVGIAVTTLAKESGAGDLYTALGLGEALKRAFGWDVKYLPKHQWRQVQGLDVYIAMRDDVDISALENAAPHLVKVAWIRNWIERWATASWAHDFDLYLCSSTVGKEYLKETASIEAEVFPIAVDVTVFNSGAVSPGLECDYVFTGNYWQSPVPREVESFDPATVPYEFHLYGKSWNMHPRFAKYWKGFTDFNGLPRVYNSAKITIDDTVTHVTKRWASVNSRVFEALACGSLVITNNEGGAQELFDGALPVWHGAGDLTALLTRYLGDAEERERLVARLRDIVITRHTYDARAKSLRQSLVESVKSLRVAIKCPVPRMSEAHAWGDYHFAKSLAKALRKQGCRVRIDIIPEWYAHTSAADDAVIVLRGLTEYRPDPAQINLLWLISHPDAVSDAELEGFDHVFVASQGYSEALAKRLQTEVSTLLQCSDPDIFRVPETRAAAVEFDPLLFVGNSRKQFRKIVQDALEQDLPLCVYGRNWEEFISAEVLRGEHVPNDSLHQFYGTAPIVLNDHWPDMARNGFISNRIFDVALSGGFVLSDEFEGSHVFEGLVPTYKDAADLRRVALRWLNDDDGRKVVAAKLRDLVLESHTFDNRAAQIAEVLIRHDHHKRGQDRHRAGHRSEAAVRVDAGAEVEA